jgi:hypothetical protein
MALYVYGLTLADQVTPAKMTGVRGGEVRSIDLGQVNVLATPIGDDDLSLNLQDIAAHNSVVEAAFARGVVLPFRAGTVVSEDVLRDTLVPELPVYVAQLEALSGHCELEVRARYDEERLLRQIMGENPELRTMSRAVNSGSPVSQQMELGELVAAFVEEHKAAASMLLDERLLTVAAAGSAMQSGGDTVLRAAYLVARPRVGELVAEARAAAAELGWLSVDVAGPVPPYSFAEPAE